MSLGLLLEPACWLYSIQAWSRLVRFDLSCMYLAHHEPESPEITTAIIVIFSIIVVVSGVW